MYIKISWTIYFLLIALFVLALSPLKEILHISGDFRDFIPYIGILGLLLVVITIMAKQGKLLRAFLVTTGVSALGWPISLYLHEILYRYFPTEPVTYILVFFILPITFLIGASGTVVIGIKQLISSK